MNGKEKEELAVLTEKVTRMHQDVLKFGKWCDDYAKEIHTMDLKVNTNTNTLSDHLKAHKTYAVGLTMIVSTIAIIIQIIGG